MKQRVLFVDDDPALLDGLRRILRKEPYEILTARSAAEALAVLCGAGAELIVADQDMPGTRGTKLLARVRDEHPDTVRFMLTGRATLEVAIEAINQGSIARFFVKPCNFVDLSVCIRQSLRQRELLREARRLLDVSRRQLALLDELERQHPGITHIRRDEGGAIVLAEEPLDDEALVRQIGEQVSAASVRVGLRAGLGRERP